MLTMNDVGAPGGRPGWHWEKRGPSRLVAADGKEFFYVDALSRVERLLTLGDLDAVEIGCGAGVVSWVGPSEARQLCRRVEPLLNEVEYYPISHQPDEYRRGAVAC